MRNLLTLCLTTSKKNKVQLERNSRKRKFKIHFVKGGMSNLIKEYFILLRKYPDSDLLIVKDTQFFIDSPFCLPKPLPDYSILYLNGDITELGENVSIELDRYYQSALVENSGCYIVAHDYVKEFYENYKNKANGKECVKEDIKKSFFLKSTYVVDNEKAVGLEDIKTPEFLDYINSDSLIVSPNKKPETINLKLNEDTPDSELPNVTLITPISSTSPEDKSLFFMTVIQFYKLDYPKDKLDWIIVDDTPEESPVQITDFLPKDKPDQRIKCIKCSPTKDSTYISVSLGKKLNVACNYASSDYFIHFFEKTFYPPNTIFHRLNYLMSGEYNCVGTTNMGIYNIPNGVSVSKREFDKKNHPVILYEPSMAYTKQFWKLGPFHEYLQNDNHQNIVCILFIFKRYNLVLDIPFMVTCTGLSTSGTELKESSGFDLSSVFPDYIKRSIEIWKDEQKHLKF